MALELPARATIDGEHVVIVSAAEYDRLIRQVGEAVEPQPGALSGRVPAQTDLTADEIIDQLDGGRGRVSRIFYDREMARFLVDRLGTKQDKQVLAECVERFGTGRAPSSTALNRFAVGVRSIRAQAHRLALAGRNGQNAR